MRTTNRVVALMLRYRTVTLTLITGMIGPTPGGDQRDMLTHITWPLAE